MTTISIPTGISGRAAQLSSAICAGTSLAPSARIPEWLPVPAAAPVQRGANSNVRGSAKWRTGLWVRPEVVPLSEKLMVLALTLSAAGGIGYGFTCLLDLVQHWAMFGAGVSQLVQ